MKTGTLESKRVTQRGKCVWEREKESDGEKEMEREGVMPVEHKVGVSAVRRLSEWVPDVS